MKVLPVKFFCVKIKYLLIMFLTYVHLLELGLHKSNQHLFEIENTRYKIIMSLLSLFHK